MLPPPKIKKLCNFCESKGSAISLKLCPVGYLDTYICCFYYIKCHIFSAFYKKSNLENTQKSIFPKTS